MEEGERVSGRGSCGEGQRRPRGLPAVTPLPAHTRPRRRRAPHHRCGRHKLSSAAASLLRLSAWAWFGIILLIILFIVVVGVVGLMLIRKQALKADVMTQGSSIYSDNGAGI